MTPEEFRAQFPIFRKAIYLNTCAQGAASIEAREAMTEFLDGWDDYGTRWVAWRERMERLRNRCAGLVGADPGEIALTHSASSGLNSIASALEWSVRDGVVTSDLDFPTVGNVWLAQTRRGANVAIASAIDGRLSSEQVGHLANQKTNVISITHVSYRNGFRVNLAEMGAVAKACGALFVVDGYQSLGSEHINVRELGVDCLVSGVMKFLLGTYGLGFLYVRHDLAEALAPTTGGWYGQADREAFDITRFEYAAGAHRFQTGSPTIAAVYVAEATLSLIEQVGWEVVRRHVVNLGSYLIQLASERGYLIRTPATDDDRGAIVSIASTDAPAAVAALGQAGIICGFRDGAIRVSFHYYNTQQDVRDFVNAIDRMPELMVTA